MIMECVAVRIVSHTRHRHKTLTNYFRSAKSSCGMHDGRNACPQMDKGGADACVFGRGGAESMTFDLKIDDRQWIPNGVIHVSYNAKNAQQRVSG